MSENAQCQEFTTKSITWIKSCLFHILSSKHRFNKNVFTCAVLTFVHCSYYQTNFFWQIWYIFVVKYSTIYYQHKRDCLPKTMAAYFSLLLLRPCIFIKVSHPLFKIACKILLQDHYHQLSHHILFNLIHNILTELRKDRRKNLGRGGWQWCNIMPKTLHKTQ